MWFLGMGGVHVAWHGDPFQPQAAWHPPPTPVKRVGSIWQGLGVYKVQGAYMGRWEKVCGVSIGQSTWQDREGLCGAGMGDTWFEGTVEGAAWCREGRCMV